MSTTPEGKAISSQNALKHGVRSKRLILPDEAEDDYRLAREGWFDEFRPETFREERLVDLLAQADWFLQRAQRRMDEAEAAVVGEENTNPADWTADQVRTVELMQRYKTTAERAFYRALNACEQTRKDNTRRAMQEYNLQLQLIKKDRELAEQDRKIAELDRKIAEREEKVERLKSKGKGNVTGMPYAAIPAARQGSSSRYARRGHRDKEGPPI